VRLHERSALPPAAAAGTWGCSSAPRHRSPGAGWHHDPSRNAPRLAGTRPRHLPTSEWTSPRGWSRHFPRNPRQARLPADRNLREPAIATLQAGCGAPLPPGQGAAAGDQSRGHHDRLRRRRVQKGRRVGRCRSALRSCCPRNRSMPARSPGAASPTRPAIASVLPPAMFASLTCPWRAVPRPSRRRTGQRSAQGPPQLAHRVAPPNRGGTASAAPARHGPRARALLPPARGTRAPHLTD
jgi:hypothetical protein